MAQNVHSVIYSEMNTPSITNNRLLESERGSYKLIFSLKALFYWRKILQFTE